MNNMLPPIFKNWFQFCYNINHYSTTFFKKDHLHKKSFRTNNSGKFSVTESATDSWNKIKDQMGEIALKDLWPSKIKWLLANKYVKSYWLIYFSFYRILFILCKYIMGIVLLYLYDSVLCFQIYTYLYIFHKIKIIPLVLSQLSGNCPLIVEPFANSEKNLKYLIFINLFKINFE